jgi:DNA-binding MarR family transcriptional regulator
VSDDDQRHSLLLALLKANHEVNRACNRVYRRFGVTHHQVRILRLLEAAGKPVRQGTLGEHMLVSRANLSGLVSRLAGASLIRRRTSRKDRRVVLLSLSDRGRQVLLSIEPIQDTVEALLFAGFDDDELDRVAELLGSVVEHAQEIG